MSACAVRLVDLTVTHQRHPAVHHLSGELALGSLTAVIGPNGAGKSSLLDALAGRLPASSGRIEIAPRLVGRIAYLPQQAQIDRSFPIGVLDLVALGHWPKCGAFGAIDGLLREKAREALASVGLSGFERRRIGELSVGQFQRVLFARVLLQDAQLILLDEPFNAIDARTSADLLAVVRRWHGESRTVVAVLHDMELVRENFPQALLLAREPVAWGPTAQVLRAENLFRARQMAERWDESAPVCERA
ncbi:ABC transporter ATP-binding protein [uncultured Piscinibacter sp.]|uniref:metal ABC transporter ATP-binding protein n=1 Tax=uncultured Piscinibacter sp. TaxID=1131835 RepID=UPI0026229BD8|nr:ABC transporter ATP-binding protein [uncultured Piscinibacter sp.]